jgi:hypothetical protein
MKRDIYWEDNFPRDMAYRARNSSDAVALYNHIIRCVERAITLFARPAKCITHYNDTPMGKL